MTRRPLVQVDVFTTEPLAGNPAVVVLDADGLDAGTMQRVANETRMPETVFVLEREAAGADYRARIFTPRVELPFAGHPTLAAVHALVESGRVPGGGTIVQECGAGLIPVDVADGLMTLTTPLGRMEDGPGAAEIGAVLGCPADRVCHAAIVDVGVAWLTVELASEGDVAALRPDLVEMERRRWDVTVFALRRAGEGPWVRVRSFLPAAGISEDAVCGSGNACVASMLAATSALPPGSRYWSTQGEECGRPGRVEVEVRDDGVRIGGRAVTVLTGELRLP